MANVQTGNRPEAATAFLEAYARMFLIRLFETAIHRLFLAGEVHGTTHLSPARRRSRSAAASRWRPTTMSPGRTADTATRWPKAPPPARWSPRCSAGRPGYAAAGPAR